MDKRKSDPADIEEKIKELEARLARKKRKLNKMAESSGSSTPPRLPQEEQNLTANQQPKPVRPTVEIEPELEIEPEEENNTESESLPEEFLIALGQEGITNEEKGQDIRKEVADRWSNLIKSGIKRENLDLILKKYPTPGNFPLATAPKLNSEMIAAVSENVLKRDKKFEFRQNLTGKVLACLGAMLTDIMKGNINSVKLIEGINDAGKILCNINHYDAVTRRHFVLTSLQNCVKQAVVDVPVGKYLFGENLAERLKSAKAVERAGTQIKITAPKKPIGRPTPSTAKNLNWKSPPLRTAQQDNKPRGGPKNQPKRTTYKHQPKPARRR